MKPITLLLCTLLLGALPLRAQQDAARWETVWHESFEKSASGAAVGAPWKQRHAQRQITVTNQTAIDGKQAATFSFEVAAEGALDKEAGLFFMEAPIPRKKSDALTTWRISAAVRFHPVAWTGTALTLRGDHYKPAVSLVNSSNMLFLGGALSMPVWSMAKPDQWYRVQITLREVEKTFDLEIGEADETYRNQFFNLPLGSETLPFLNVSFGYVGALVRYGQDRQTFIDDIRVERLAR